MSTKMQSNKRTRSDTENYTSRSNGKPTKSFGNNSNTKPYQKSSNGYQGSKKSAPTNKWGKGKETYQDNAPPVKRKIPVTQGGGEIDVNDEEDEDVDMSGGEELPEGGEGEDVGPVEKRPRLSKAEKAALHAAQPHRTTLLASYPLLQQCLPLWETARKSDIPKEERRKAIEELWGAVKGRVGEISKGHKGGRILQTIVKYGGKEERLGVAMELRPQWRAMMESKYSKFLMGKLIRYCPSIRPLLIEDLSTHMESLLFHADAVQPLSDFYDLYSSAAERRLIIRGLYPREVKIFDNAKEGGAQSLDNILEGMGEDGAGRERILDGVEKTVMSVFNATQKTALAQPIFHRLVFEYLTCIYRFLPAEAAEKRMHELLTTGQESLPEIVHTKDGSAVVRELLVRGNAKDRKQILQPLRKHLPAMAKDGDAQTVLFTAFDVVDDTKLMGKAFATDLAALTPEFANDKNVRRSILYLLSPTSTKHYIPSTIASLAASATQARELGTSKKDPKVRRKELLGYASPGLLKAVEDSGEALVRDAGAGLVVQEIMLYAEGDKSAAIESLVKPLRTLYPEDATTDTTPDPQTAHVLDLPHSIRTYKTLLSGGYFNNTTKSVEVVDPVLPGQFASAVWKAIISEEAGSGENAIRVAKGNAAFVLVEMIAALGEVDLKEVKRVLGDPLVRKSILEEGRKGSGLLVEKLAAL